MHRFALATALAVCAQSVVFAQPHGEFHDSDIVSVSHDNDPDVKGKPVTEVVILSDGYPDALKARFEERAKQIMKSLREDLASSVMREVTTFHFTTVWVPSRAKGAPWYNGAPAEDTPFKSHVDADGSLASDDGAVDRAVKHVSDGNFRTVPVVLINLLSKEEGKPKKGETRVKDANTGPGDVRDISDTPEDVYRRLIDKACTQKHGHEVGRVHQVDIDMRAFVHEFGHARFGLDDEYANDPTEALPADQKAGVAQFPNNTIERDSLRWETAVPELYQNGKLKAPLIEGGSGYGKDVWHAFHLCRMNQSRTEDFCPVCKSAIRASLLDGKPLAAPVWVDPSSKDGTVKVTVEKDGTKTIPIRWKPGNAEQPNSWHVELTDATGKVVFKADLEGQLRSKDIPAPAAGRYTLSIEARRIATANPANISEATKTPLFLPRNPETVARADADSTAKRFDRGFDRTPGLDGKLTEAVRRESDKTHPEEDGR
jgi:hypothetical protein